MDFLYCIIYLCFAWITFRALYFFAGRSKAIPRIRLPPGPKPFPLIGNLFELGDKPHLYLTKLSQRYGPIISLQLGQLTTVVISTPTLAKEILRTHDHVFSNRTIPDAAHAGKHSEYSLGWLPVSARWRNLRTICNLQLFSPKVLDANQANRHVKVQKLIDDVNESMRAGEAIDIGRAAFTTTLNLMSQTILSVDLADQSSEMAGEFKKTVWCMVEEIAKPNLADYFPLLRKVDPQGIRRRMTYYFQKTILIFDRMIQQRENINMPEIQHLILDLFSAGTDTSSATMEWAMAELLRNPEVLSKAQAELEQVIGKGKLVEESDIAQLPYLKAIIKENFRLHPTVPLLLPRKAEADVEIEGYIVPKGAQVLVNAWAIGRDPSTWDNPNLFRPERRICPGLPLAKRMLPSMLGSLINCFDWKLEDGFVPETMNMKEKFGLTLHMAQPLRAVPKKS
ncbi:hypothetical protein M0R45_021557 [Rubus argutus]|uniref:Geraniol 8-hydroxylase n=1 Tax=Rubus argutus TaxID=59490 RepID=A0AAW1XBS7_RUBAR